MADYSLTQAQDMVTQTVSPQTVPGEGGDLGGAGGGGTSTSGTLSPYRRLVITNPQKMLALAQLGINAADFSISDLDIANALYVANIADYSDLNVLRAEGQITSADVKETILQQQGPSGPSAGPYGGGITAKDINDAYTRVQNGTATFADKVLLDRVSSDRLLYGAGGGNSAGQQAQIGYNYAQLAENQRQFGITNPQEELQRQQGYLQNRATTGLNLGDFVRGLSNDVYQRALDPGNYPAYLAASAGVPQGTGSPISALIGQGVQIQPPGGSNPLADPRFQNLIGNLYDYAQPGALQTVQGIAAQNGGTLPPEFYKYTGTQAPAHAQGGTQMLNGPTVGIPQGQLMPGQTPQFLAGEAGPERIDFTPMHQHETVGMPVPHQHSGGDAKHEHMGNMIRYADGGTAIAGTEPTAHQLNASWNAYHPDAQRPDTTFTPAEGTAISLGKALQPLGYVPSYLTSQLLEGRTPTPGSIDEATLMRLPPSLRALLQAQVRSALGGAGLQDYNAALDQNALPGLNAGRTQTIYG